MAGKWIIVGGGGFGREALGWLRDLGSSESGVDVAGYLDDSGERMADYSYGLPYLGTISEHGPDAGAQYLLTVGDPAAKRAIFESLSSAGARFASVIHPSAVVATTARIGEGSIVGPNSYAAVDCQVGRCVTINSLCGIGHDSSIGDFATLSSQIDVTAEVKIGEGVFVGSGARILPGARVGEGARIGAGSIVARNVAAGTTVYAAVAKKL